MVTDPELQDLEGTLPMSHTVNVFCTGDCALAVQTLSREMHIRPSVGSMGELKCP